MFCWFSLKPTIYSGMPWTFCWEIFVSTVSVIAYNYNRSSNASHTISASRVKICSETIFFNKYNFVTIFMSAHSKHVLLQTLILSNVKWCSSRMTQFNLIWNDNIVFCYNSENANLSIIMYEIKHQSTGRSRYPSMRAICDVDSRKCCRYVENAWMQYTRCEWLSEQFSGTKLRKP